MKSALFFCLVVFNCCPKENVILCVVITPSSLSVLMKRSFVLIWSSSPSYSCWASADNPHPPTPHPLPSPPVWFCIHSFDCLSDSSQNFTFSFDLLHEGFRRNAANIEIPLPYHVVNNEETCLHLLCFRLTELKTSMICPPARKLEFGLWSELMHVCPGSVGWRLSGQLTIAAVVMFGSKTVLLSLLSFLHLVLKQACFFFAWLSINCSRWCSCQNARRGGKVTHKRCLYIFQIQVLI